jgi:hypothetical protein
VPLFKRLTADTPACRRKIVDTAIITVAGSRPTDLVNCLQSVVGDRAQGGVM